MGEEQTLLRVGVISMYVAVIFTLVAAALILILRDEPRAVFATELASRTTEERPASLAKPLPEPPAAAPRPEPEPWPPEPPKVESPKLEPRSEPPEPDPPQRAEPKSQQRFESKPEPAALSEVEQAKKKPAEPEPVPEARRDPRPAQPPEPKPAPEARKKAQEAKERSKQNAASAPALRAQRGGGEETGKRPADREAKPPELPSGAVMTLSAGALGLHDVPVKSSASGRALDGGVVHLPDTSLPWDSGEGGKNVYLAGHRLGWPGTGSHRVFYRLDELRRGDWIVLKDARGRKYQYRVTGSSVVSPGDSWVKDPVPGRDMLTLQTCTPLPSFEKRLIVRANRV